MDNVISEKQREAIKALVLSCGEIMLNAQAESEMDTGITVKPGDANFVTKFDVAVQQALIKGLLEIFPDAVFLAEEKDNSELDVNSGICFIIDPIDGTTNFIHGLDASSISVGMLYNGEPYFGAVYNPYRREYFDAQAEKGAYLNGKAISVSQKPLSLGVVGFGTTPYYRDEYETISFEKAKIIFDRCVDIRRSGSAAIDLANVACGRLDGFFEFSLSPWDYAAGYVIVTEAGGKVTSFDGKRVNFAEPSSVLCANAVVHDSLREILNN